MVLFGGICPRLWPLPQAWLCCSAYIPVGTRSTPNATHGTATPMRVTSCFSETRECQIFIINAEMPGAKLLLLAAAIACDHTDVEPNACGTIWYHMHGACVTL